MASLNVMSVSKNTFEGHVASLQLQTAVLHRVHFCQCIGALLIPLLFERTENVPGIRNVLSYPEANTGQTNQLTASALQSKQPALIGNKLRLDLHSALHGTRLDAVANLNQTTRQASNPPSW